MMLQLHFEKLCCKINTQTNDLNILLITLNCNCVSLLKLAQLSLLPEAAGCAAYMELTEIRP